MPRNSNDLRMVLYNVHLSCQEWAVKYYARYGDYKLALIKQRKDKNENFILLIFENPDNTWRAFQETVLQQPFPNVGVPVFVQLHGLNVHPNRLIRLPDSVFIRDAMLFETPNQTVVVRVESPVITQRRLRAFYSKVVPIKKAVLLGKGTKRYFYMLLHSHGDALALLAEFAGRVAGMFDWEYGDYIAFSRNPLFQPRSVQQRLKQEAESEAPVENPPRSTTYAPLTLPEEDKPDSKPQKKKQGKARKTATAQAKQEAKQKQPPPQPKVRHRQQKRQFQTHDPIA